MHKRAATTHPCVRIRTRARVWLAVLADKQVDLQAAVGRVAAVVCSGGGGAAGHTHVWVWVWVWVMHAGIGMCVCMLRLAPPGLFFGADCTYKRINQNHLSHKHLFVYPLDWKYHRRTAPLVSMLVLVSEGM